MEKLNLLVIDTSNDVLKIGLSVNGKESFVDNKNSFKHIENLIPTIDKMISDTGEDKKSINYIGICEGPGSFTGIRIGLATVYGLSFGNNITPFGFSQFEVYKYLLESSHNMIVPVIDAKKNRFYCSFIKQGTDFEMFDLTESEILEKVEENSIFVGNDFNLFKNKPSNNFFSHRYEDGYSAKDLISYSKYLIKSQKKLRYPDPIYLRKSEAEISLLSK
ncbi:MAG TPA: tRNA (adenosine(37)-N6)-threonylcarbamoyltransferase complex dimerization subunit type 1 TsaB [Spirochaetota bacterium]|nr:tRNA (adenosine(37)-N6)-threonylcarbamoyltransferase complex dimerization subunit type 1 TsaB [Spirochaetota bacterium]